MITIVLLTLSTINNFQNIGDLAKLLVMGSSIGISDESVSQYIHFLYASLFLRRCDQITASLSTSVTWSHILAGGDREGEGEAKSLEIQSNYIQIIYSNVVKAALSIFDLA